MFSRFAFIAAVTIVAAWPPAPSAAAAEKSADELKAEAVGLVQDYAATLQASLHGALEASGAVTAISFCHDRAPQIAADISRRSGWTVGRTSLKIRNAASAPDSYETKVMEEFQARIAKGEAVSDLAKAEIVEIDGAKVFHFSKAIPTAQMCLTCHGEDVRPEIKAKLGELYPGDKAVGFKAGDMRGIFTVSKAL